MASFRKTGRCADVGSPGAELRNEANCGGASQGAGCFHPGYAGTTLDNQKRRDSVKIAAMLWKKPRLRSRSAIGNNGPIEFVNRSGADGPPRPSYLGKGQQRALGHQLLQPRDLRLELPQAPDVGRL